MQKKKNALDFNRSVIDVIKAIRKSKNIKQAVLAKALSMTECNYCKMEKHYKALTVPQLIIISGELDVTVRKIIFLSEGLMRIDLTTPTQVQILQFFNSSVFNVESDFADLDLAEIFTRIRIQRGIIKRGGEDGGPDMLMEPFCQYDLPS